MTAWPIISSATWGLMATARVTYSSFVMYANIKCRLASRSGKAFGSETRDASAKGASLALAHLDLCIPCIAHHENEGAAGIRANLSYALKVNQGGAPGTKESPGYKRLLQLSELIVHPVGIVFHANPDDPAVHIKEQRFFGVRGLILCVRRESRRVCAL